MKKCGKKILSVGLASIFLSTGICNARTRAIDWSMVLTNVISSTIASSIPKLLEKIYDTITFSYDKLTTHVYVEKYKGFRNPKKIIKNLYDIANNKSEIKIYGQEKAKSQMVDVLSSIVANFENIKHHKNDIKEIRGNIVYLIGRVPGSEKQKCVMRLPMLF